MESLLTLSNWSRWRRGQRSDFYKMADVLINITTDNSGSWRRFWRSRDRRRRSRLWTQTHALTLQLRHHAQYLLPLLFQLLQVKSPVNSARSGPGMILFILAQGLKLVEQRLKLLLRVLVLRHCGISFSIHSCMHLLLLHGSDEHLPVFDLDFFRHYILGRLFCQGDHGFRVHIVPRFGTKILNFARAKIEDDFLENGR